MNLELFEGPEWRKWKVPGICALLAALVFLILGKAVGYGFIHYDDNEYVFENPMVSKGLSIDGIAWAFTHVHAANWHPLTTILLMLDCQAFGLWPGGHHLVNLLLHAAGVVLLFLLLLEMTEAMWRGAFVAAVFAIHPLRVESVAWVSELKDVLCGLFFMLTLRAYVRYARHPEGRRRSGPMVVLWFALGLMSKPMLVTVPFLLLLLDWWPLGRLAAWRDLPGLLREKLPIFALIPLSCLATLLAQKKAIGNLPLSLRFADAIVGSVVYLGKFIWPSHLAVLYPLSLHGWPAWQVIASALLLTAFTAAAWLVRRREPCLLFGWLWYLGMLVPVSGIVHVGSQAYADRYTYLPQIGLCISGAWLAADWAGTHRHRRVALGAASAAILTVLSIAAWRQVSFWRDDITLWTHTLECTTGNSSAYSQLGNALLAQGRTGEGIAQFREALRLNPALVEAHFSLGNALVGRGQASEGMAQLREALRIDPAYADAHNSLGTALLGRGRTDDAVAEFREALRLNAELPEVHNNLGIALFRQGQARQAIAEFRDAVRIKPAFAQAHFNLGNALLEQGETVEGIARIREALRLNPANERAHYSLGKALLAQGRTDEAVAELRQASRLNPADARTHNTLGIALFRQGHAEEGTTEFRKASNLDPADAQSHNNLAKALLDQGRTGEAINEARSALELQPASGTFQNNLAWMLATAQPISLRNGARAVQLAMQASQSSGGNKDPAILRTLAAAYAQAGKYTEAVRTARSALQVAENGDLAGTLRRDLKFYETGHPLPDGQ